MFNHTVSESILNINNKELVYKYWGDKSDLDVIKSIRKPFGFTDHAQKNYHEHHNTQMRITYCVSYGF